MAKTKKVVPKKKVAAKKVVKKKSRANSPKGGSFIDGIRDAAMPTSGLKVALYGISGSGKSTFACSFPGKKLIIRCGSDDGELSIYDVPDVQVTPLVKKSKDIDEVLELQRNENLWDTIILDTASELRMICLMEVLALEETPVQLSWGMANQQEWGAAALGTKKRLREMLDIADSMGTNVIIIAQEGVIGGEDSGGPQLFAPTIAQDLGKSTVGFLNPACDYVLQTFIRKHTHERKYTVKIGGKNLPKTETIEEMQYCLRTGVDDVYTTKFRKPKGVKIESILVDPDYEKFYKMVSGSKV